MENCTLPAKLHANSQAWGHTQAQGSVTEGSSCLRLHRQLSIHLVNLSFCASQSQPAQGSAQITASAHISGFFCPDRQCHQEEFQGDRAENGCKKQSRRPWGAGLLPASPLQTQLDFFPRTSASFQNNCMSHLYLWGLKSTADSLRSLKPRIEITLILQR